MFFYLFTLFASYNFTQSEIKDINEEKIYKKNRQNRKCIVENLAGNQPQKICDIAHRLKQSLINPVVYPNAFILYGPPGTGKTSLVKAIEKMAEAKLVHRTASSMITVKQGSGAQSIKDVFVDVKKLLDNGEKVILFIDEIDCFSKERTATSNDDHVGALMELNTKVSEYENDPRLVIIIATNKEKFLDLALLSRFEPILIPLPDYQMCVSLFTHYLNKYQHELGDKISDFALKAYKAKMSCRDIRHIVVEAYWQSESTGATKILEGAMNDEIEIMIKKKEQESEEKEKMEAQEKRRSEMIELEYHALIAADEERFLKSLSTQRTNESKNLKKQIENGIDGLQSLAEALKKLKKN